LSFFSRRAQERGNNWKQTCGKKNAPEMDKRGYLLKVIFREVIIILLFIIIFWEVFFLFPFDFLFLL